MVGHSDQRIQDHPRLYSNSETSSRLHGTLYKGGHFNGSPKNLSISGHHMQAVHLALRDEQQQNVLQNMLVGHKAIGHSEIQEIPWGSLPSSHLPKSICLCRCSSLSTRKNEGQSSKTTLDPEEPTEGKLSYETFLPIHVSSTICCPQTPGPFSFSALVWVFPSTKDGTWGCTDQAIALLLSYTPHLVLSLCLVTFQKKFFDDNKI